MGLKDAYAYVSFPDEANLVEKSSGFWIMIFILIIVAIGMAIGLLVQFTEVANSSDISNYKENVLKIEDKKSKIGLFFYAFSPANNFVKLFNVGEPQDDNLVILNGIRTLCMWWVVFGHGYILSFDKPIVNLTESKLLLEPMLFSIIAAGPYSVDVFFTLSGFLTFYIIALKSYPSRGLKRMSDYLLLYFHRYYRLIFPVMFVTLFTMHIMVHLGDGPFFKEDYQNMYMYTNCKDKWWTTFLFINNLYPWKLGDEGISWVWYLANDFQFYLISPPIILLYCKNRKYAYALIVCLILICMMYNAIVSGILNLGPISTEGDEISQYDIIYSKPWGRMSTYFLGALFGLGYFEKTKTDKYPHLKNSTFNKYFNLMANSGIFCFTQAIVGFGMILLFSIPMRSFIKDCDNVKNCWSLPVTILFTTFYRVGFILGILFIILPAMGERFKAIKYILSANIFTVGARLSYGVYLTHILVILWFYGDSKQGIFITHLYLSTISLGTIVVSFFLAIPITLICEVPFLNIEKYVLFSSSKIVEKLNDSALEIKGTGIKKHIPTEMDSGDNLKKSKKLEASKKND